MSLKLTTGCWVEMGDTEPGEGEGCFALCKEITGLLTNHKNSK